MLEQLFGSRTRWKLLKVFLSRLDEKFFVRELTRLTGEKINSIRRELANLEDLGIIISHSNESDVNVKIKSKKIKISKQVKKYFQVNTNFSLLNELRELIMKSWLLVENSLVKKLTKLGSVNLLILTGRFVNQDEVDTDVLIVGSINRDKVGRLMQSLSKSFGEDIKYTVMTKKEYTYRHDITDKFLYNILENKHVKMIDQLS